MKRIKVMSVFGTRPEAIKMAPLVQTLAQRPEFESICCLTGQHREMLDSVMQIFRLTAQYDLNIMQKQQTLSSITTRAPARHGAGPAGGTAGPCPGARRYVHDVRRGAGGLLSEGPGRPCRGGPADL